MNGDDFESTLRDGMHGAIDPIVPGANAENRVMDAVAASTAKRRSRFAGLPIGQGLGSVLVASVVVLLVGGALGVSLALRGTTGQQNHPAISGPPAPAGATATPTPLFSPPPSPTADAGPVACQGAMLTATFTDFDGAAGSEGGDIALQNSSDAPCTMDGYVNLQGSVDGQVTQLGVTRVQAVLINNSNGTLPTVQLITLQPGQTAYVAVEWTDVQSTATACATYQTLVVTPPQGRNAVTMAVNPPVTPSFELCASHGAAIWIDEAPVSLTRYFAQP